MHLVFNHVAEFQHVGDTHCGWLVEAKACFTIVEISTSVARKLSLVGPFAEVVEVSTIEDWSCELHTEFGTSRAEDGFENLTDVHTRWHTQRVEHDIDRSTILKEWHIFLANHLGNNTLVTVATCHLVSNTNLTFLSDVNLCHLDDARWEFIANSEGKLLALEFCIKKLVFLEIVDDELTNQRVGVLVVCPTTELNRSIVENFKCWSNELGAFWYDFSTEAVLHTH